MSRWATVLRWQVPHVAFCYAYFPMTATKRLLRLHGRSYRTLDPLGRRFRDKWGFLPPELSERGREGPVWMNMYSLGEALNAAGVLKRLRVAEGPYVLSTESYDSYDLLGRAYGRHRTFFAPWDLTLPARRDLRVLRPKALVFFQNSYFPTLLREARRAGVTCILVNGLLSRNVQVGIAPMQRALALEFYRQMDALSVQSEEDYAAFARLGVPAERMIVTGNLASDLSHLPLAPVERDELRRRLGLGERNPVVIVGSAHAGEQTVMSEAFEGIRRRVPEARFIVAPRWMHEAERIMQQFQARGFRVMRRTRLEAGRGEGRYDVLVLDTFGELATVYGVADVAFIGSSLVPINERRGGHNPMEPLAHGVVPLFGPHMNLWPSVVDELREAWSGLEVHSPEQLAERACAVLSGHAPVSAIREVGARLIDSSKGAVEGTVAFLRRHLKLDDEPPSPRRIGEASEVVGRG